MSKSSIEYVELAGLRITLSHLLHQKSKIQDLDKIAAYLRQRIKELEDK